jgi:hypothetical protein|tara:strand:- start:428 stop:646 length:219 start_codon:yes stop_codon:yes gene_type:complete
MGKRDESNDNGDEDSDEDGDEDGDVDGDIGSNLEIDNDYSDDEYEQSIGKTALMHANIFDVCGSNLHSPSML